MSFYGVRLLYAASFGLVLLLANPFALIAQDEAKALVTRSLDKEMAERKVAQHLFYVSRERSSRTGGHLWLENVVETEGGEIRRLISIDGTPLSPERTREEDARITKLAAQGDRKS